MRPEGETSAVGLPPPPVVLVHRFGVNLDEVTENQSLLQQQIDAAQNQTATQRSEQIARDVSDALADRLVADINAMGLSAQRATRETAVPREAVVVSGTSSTSTRATAGVAVANAGLTGVKGYRSQVDAMARRSADRTAQYLSQFFASQGWIAPSAVLPPPLP